MTFNHIKFSMGKLLDDKRTWRVWDSAQQSLIEHRPTGGACPLCWGQPRRSCMGSRLQLIIIDEPAQFSQAQQREESYAVLRTGMGKVEGSRMIALGTRPQEGQQHFFNDLMEDADYVQAHMCIKDTDPDFQKQELGKGVPVLARRYAGAPEGNTERKRERAKKNAALLPSFRSLRLNMGTAPTTKNHVLDAETWAAAESATVERVGRYVLCAGPQRRGGDVWGGGLLASNRPA